MSKKEPIILSVGGSLIVPNGGINISFLKNLDRFIREKIAKGWRFFIVTGGGSTARHYQESVRKVGRKLERDDLDWLGIHATRINAHLLRTILRDLSHIKVIKDPSDIEIATEPVVIAAGWKPGWSTDYIAATLAKEYGIKTLINMTNISMVYDKDPKEFPEAKPLPKLSWKKFRELVGDGWMPGMSAPFDPVAAKLASEIGLKVIILKGDDFENLEKVFAGKEFVGTVIE